MKRKRLMAWMVMMTLLLSILGGGQIVWADDAPIISTTSVLKNGVANQVIDITLENGMFVTDVNSLTYWLIHSNNALSLNTTVTRVDDTHAKITVREALVSGNIEIRFHAAAFTSDTNTYSNLIYVNIPSAGALAMSPDNLPIQSRASESFSQTFFVTGGEGAKTLTLENSTLPSNFSLLNEYGSQGTLRGEFAKDSAGKEYTFKIRVTDDLGAILERDYTLKVNELFATDDGFIFNGEAVVGYSGSASAIVIPSVINERPVMRIGLEAFKMNQTITSVIIPEGVTHIGDSAFMECSQLKTIKFPDTLLSIGALAFNSNNSMTNTIIPASVKVIGGAAFSWRNYSVAQGVFLFMGEAPAIEDFTFDNNVAVKIYYPVNAKDYKTPWGVRKMVPYDPAATYTLTYNGNDSTEGTVPEALTGLRTMDSTTLQGNVGNLSKPGFRFVGWNTLADGKGTKYKGGNLIFGQTENITLYAQMAPLYTVNIGAIEGGRVTVDKTTALSNEWVTLQLAPNEGQRYKQDSISFKDSSGSPVSVLWDLSVDFAQIYFLMPKTDITVALAFESVPTNLVTVVSGTGGGSFVEKSAVNITADPAPRGQVFDKWITDDGITFADTNASSTSFIMPAKAVTVTAVYKNVVPNPNKPAIKLAGFMDLFVGEPVSISIPVLGENPMTWSISSGALPSGLILSADGSVSGTPTIVGTSTFTLKAINSVGEDLKSYSIVVKNKVTPSNPGGGSSAGSQPSTPVVTIPVVAIPLAAPELGSVTIATATIAKMDTSGKAMATVTEAQITDAVKKAVEEANKKGKGIKAKLEIQVNGAADAKSVETSFPKAAYAAMSDGQVDALTIVTPIATMTFDEDSLSTIAKGSTEDVKITVSQVDSSTLSEETKKSVGDKPVFNFNVTSGGKTISQFGGIVKVSIPYTPKLGEVNHGIVIYYINAKGTLEMVSNCAYDPVTGMIEFNTNHFSLFAVGYHPVTFADVAPESWYNNPVCFIAARGITNGNGVGRFDPNGSLTRSQLLVMVMRAYGISPDLSGTANFTDAGNTYYTGYLAAAKRLGISAGIGNNLFAPDKAITRQEMAKLLQNTLEYLNQVPDTFQGEALKDYTDAVKIADWAKDPMSLFVSIGAIKGDKGVLSPTRITTRAEMALALYELMTR